MDHIELDSSQAVHELDESVWQAWRQKNRRRDELAVAGRITAVKCFCIAALLATIVLWIHASQFGLALKAVVATGAAVVTYQAAAMHRYGFAVVFALIVLLFNPFIAVVGLSGVWDLGVLVATIGAFSSSLVWLRSGLESSRSL